MNLIYNFFIVLINKMNNLKLIDEYIIRRKGNKIQDLLAMIITSAKVTDPLLYTHNFDAINIPVRNINTPGYNINGLYNNDMGYYYITRCYSEKIFNKEVFKGTLIENLSFNNSLTNINNTILSIKNIYNNLISNDDRYYYYDIGFSDHTFIIVKFNNSFRLIQSWMLKYQLENIIFDNDIHYSFPKFITILFIFQFYKCNRGRYNILTLIKMVFECNNLTAKQYLIEFKKLFIMIFSKELHIHGNMFNLYLEQESEKYLCPDNNSMYININKYCFNPVNVMKDYDDILKNIIDIELKNFPLVNDFYTNKMNVIYPFYDINSEVIISESIKEIINYNIYPYLFKDHHYDSIVLNYIISNYNIKLDSQSILSKLISLAKLKNTRDTELVKMSHTEIYNQKKTILSIYKKINMEQFGGVNFNNLTNLINLYTGQKIEKKLTLKLFNIMQIIENNIKDNIIFNSINKLKIFENNEINQIYLNIKDNIIKIINDYIRVTFKTLLSKLNITQQLILIIKFYLTDSNLKPILSEFINMFKRKFYDFISEIIKTEIIPNFYKVSYNEQLKLLNDHNIINSIDMNSKIIIDVLDKISFKLPNEIDKINIYQCEISDISNDRISDIIIINYVLPKLSNPDFIKKNEYGNYINKDTDKLKILFAIKTHTKSESGIKYIDNILESEILFCGSLKKIQFSNLVI